MAGKDGSTQQAAAAGLATAEPDQPQPIRKFYVVHNHNDHENYGGRTTASKGRGLLDRTLQAQLGNLLRAVFSDVAEEPVPERFVKLLEALAAKEKSR
jgi:hypothetical protein